MLQLARILYKLARHLIAAQSQGFRPKCAHPRNKRTRRAAHKASGAPAVWQNCLVALAGRLGEWNTSASADTHTRDTGNAADDLASPLLRNALDFVSGG